MTRHKGRTGTKAIERNFPHVIEMAIPPGGLGKRLDALHEWHKARGILSHGSRGRHDEGTFYIRWYFTEAATADAFLVAFGGDRITAVKAT
jgi:hypothetical protein